ncbi:Acylneuraminate cytidylyltransferase [Dillenia turbinata]|uniref:Acylneuraminate cytidylyltransferase n=1 Tax=Dillenia turbinata TaxID=194707 RepID=A0AAN8ZHL2_9MAGN
MNPMAICSSESSSGNSSSSKALIVHSVVLGTAALGAHYFLRSRKFRTRVVGIIPARFTSSRSHPRQTYDSKNLGEGKVGYNSGSHLCIYILGGLVVATDDEKIAECCRLFGTDVIMTSESCQNGNERCNEALQKLGKNYDVVVNIQGDEPLIEPEIIDKIVKALQVSLFCCGNNRKPIHELFDSVVYVWKGQPIVSLLASSWNSGKLIHSFSYDSYFLKIYPELPPTPLQLEEDLEQLKVMENGYKMKDCHDRARASVDVEGDRKFYKAFGSGLTCLFRGWASAMHSLCQMGSFLCCVSQRSRTFGAVVGLVGHSGCSGCGEIREGYHDILDQRHEFAAKRCRLPRHFSVWEIGNECMKVIKVDHEAHGVDTPEDVERIERLMLERNLD